RQHAQLIEGDGVEHAAFYQPNRSIQAILSQFCRMITQGNVWSLGGGMARRQPTRENDHDRHQHEPP
ncbi:MAG: hypothetical protein ACRC56_12990, partial [Bosea sp. (in: a-proteobacteria)]